MNYRRVLTPGIALLAVAVCAAGGWFYYQRLDRWRDLEADVLVYLKAARAGDSAEVLRRAADPNAAQRVLTMARSRPEMMDTLISSLRLRFGVDKPFSPNEAIAMFRTRSSFCEFADGVYDEFQVTAVRTAQGWRYKYSGVTPC